MANKLTHTVELEEIKDVTSLPEDYQKLLILAKDQLEMAYAPYSNFHVGAGVLLENGSMYGGSNQENASYPLCMCGERTALYHAHAIHKNVPVKAVAITARNPKMKMTKPVMPCGACRQVIAEYEMRHGKEIDLLFLTDDNVVYLTHSIAGLLPFGFDKSFLL